MRDAFEKIINNSPPSISSDHHRFELFYKKKLTIFQAYLSNNQNLRPHAKKIFASKSNMSTMLFKKKTVFNEKQKKQIKFN